tara:strand:- start:99 stop:461 length:363 start_codon:yes stop_codon:yes gene_type:complete
MMHYETVFIVNPVLSEDQAGQTAKKYEDFLKTRKADIVAKESWGLKKLAYSIEKKKSGFYFLFEFKSSDENIISDFELDFKRDERVMRWMTVKLDKHSIAYAEKRRERLQKKDEKKIKIS